MLGGIENGRDLAEPLRAGVERFDQRRRVNGQSCRRRHRSSKISASSSSIVSALNRPSDAMPTNDSGRFGAAYCAWTALAGCAALVPAVEVPRAS
jgi:hypothetical protein